MVLKLLHFLHVNTGIKISLYPHPFRAVSICSPSSSLNTSSPLPTFFGNSRGFEDPHQFNYSQQCNFLLIYRSSLLFHLSSVYLFIHSSHLSPLSPLHADPGGVKDAHQSQHPLQDVSDDIRGHTEGADLRQSFWLDVSHCTLCFIYQRLEGSNCKQRKR